METTPEVNRNESQFALSVSAESFVPKVDETQIVPTACFKNKCFLSSTLILVKDKYSEWQSFRAFSYSKRDVLFTIAKIFDPVGLMAPVISKANVFFQRLWRKAFEIHGFADASERCYGAEVYSKFENSKRETLVRLITSKSRVEPIKSLRNPRLELCAAVLLAKLVKRVVAALQLETAELYLWPKSMIVLAFVENLKGISTVTGPLIKEFEKAETLLVKKEQQQEFSGDINKLKKELYYGEDKEVRVVKIKSQYSTCKRAISKICVLPMEALWECPWIPTDLPLPSPEGKEGQLAPTPRRCSAGCLKYWQCVLEECESDIQYHPIP
ncbi:uncharacterized protein TNCV_1008251 [Trichonephila clavipes]|nr:uncharacterized protein TNCV_1008251 [Trichonephila clavipes]